jgi:hypothetical protein
MGPASPIALPQQRNQIRFHNIITHLIHDEMLYLKN